jgi:MFS transporter, DHA1 family, multidrug resistance protein
LGIVPSGRAAPLPSRPHICPAAARIAKAPHTRYSGQMNRHFIIAFCGIMLALNAISCDMLLPGFFTIQADLNTSIDLVQATIPVFLMAAAAGQLIFGPSSDRWGRRRVLMAGLLFYLAGSTLAIYARSIEALLLARFLQGFGASCAVVIARAILRDTHGGAELARAMALAMAIFAIGPLLAPLTGVGLIALGGWRATFVGQLAVGLALLIVALLIYRETNPQPNPNALNIASLREAAGRVIRQPQSRYFMLVCIFLQTAVIVFIVNMPRLFKTTFDVDSQAFALLFALGAVGIIIGQLISNRMIARVGVLPTLRGAATLLAVTGLTTWVSARIGAPSVAVFTGLLFVFNLSFLVVFTNCVSLVLDPHRDIAGMASALFGSMTQLVGNTAALIVVPYIDGRMIVWTNVHLALIAAVVAMIWAFQPAQQTLAPETR